MKLAHILVNGPVLATYKNKLKISMGTLLKTSEKKINKPFTTVISTSVAIVFEVKNNGYTCKLRLNFFVIDPNFEYACLLKLIQLICITLDFPTLQF